jgi:hypothetical protein
MTTPQLLEPPRHSGDDEPRLAEGRRPRDARVLSRDAVADRPGRPDGAAGQEGDPRRLSALVVKADRPVLFERVRGFDIPVVGGLF